MKRQSASRSVAVRVSALVGTLIVILSACIMPASATMFDDVVEVMDSVTLSSLRGSGAKQEIIDIDEYTDLGKYTEEEPFYAYFLLYEETYDYAKSNSSISADPLINLNFVFFDSANYLTYRWSGGMYGAPVQHQIRKYNRSAPSTLWEYFTYGEPFKAIDEIFIRMWYNETTDQLVCRVTIRDEYFDQTTNYYINWGEEAPKIRLIVRDCTATIKYAFGREAMSMFALTNVDEIYNQGVTAGLVQGYDSGWAAGEESGYNKGYDVGANEGYNEGLNAGELAGYDKGYSKGRDDGFVEGFSQGGADSIKGLANYCEAQGIKFVDQPSSIEAIYKAIKDRGWTEAADQGTLTTKLIFTALEAPINVVLGAANFEVFGINFAGVTFAILAAVLVLFILRVIVDVIV